MVLFGCFKETRHLLWVGIFLGLFLLSFDFWNWNLSKPLFLGLPFWVYYHIILTISLSFVFWFFTKSQWREKDD